MFEKKLHYKENNNTHEKQAKLRIITKKNNNSPKDKNQSLDNIIQIEDEMIINPFRGRQPNNNMNSINKNFLNLNNSNASTIEIKRREDNKREMMKKKFKANSTRLKIYQNNTKLNKKDEDEYSSVDSISEESNNSKTNKKMQREKNQIKSKKKINLENNENNFAFDESKELDFMQEEDYSGGLIYNLDDNSESFERLEGLNIEIERILIDVYNNHIKSDKKKCAMNISKYENHMRVISCGMDECENIYIMKIFSEKIKELIDRYREKILEIPDIKIIKDKYYEIKDSFNYDDKKYRDNPIDLDLYPGLKESIKQIMNILLIELRNIKNALINSSADLILIFVSPLQHMKTNGKRDIFPLEDMHKQEFFSTLIEDDFISFLLYHIRVIARELKIDEFTKIIDNLENDSHDYGMSFFNEYIKEKINFNSNELQMQNIENNNNSIASIGYSYKGPIQTIMNSNNKNKQIENLDDLVAYINSNDKPSKKNKKKNLKKKIANSKQNIKHNICSHNYIDDESVEKFKNDINSNSIFACFSRKIKPIISIDWINSLKL